MGTINLTRIQKRLFDMGVEIAEVLERHDIPYMITFGTLLGAVRHNGFIPWDDDFDFCLFSDTYDIALEYLRKELKKGLFVEDEQSEPLYFHGWAHVKDLNSEVVYDEFPQDGLYMHHGLSVDLYKAKEMEEKDLNDYIIDEHIAYLKRKYSKKIITKEDFDSKINNLRSKKKVLPLYSSVGKVYGLNLPEQRMEYNDVVPLKRIIFNGHYFFGPSNPDGILTKFYGNYMELPSEEQRIPHYSSVIFKK